MKKYVLDTHTIIWYLLGSLQMPQKIRKVIEENKKFAYFYVPTIVLGEIASILEKGKVKGDLRLLINAIKMDPRFMIVPFDESIFEYYLDENKNLEMHDRIIVATSKFLNAYLISKDKTISKYYPKTIW